ncbi:DUF4862 family protein [Promicromonospora xylanilytica]
MTGLLVSTYPAAPTEARQGSGSVDAYYRGLRSVEGIGSIELPVAADGSLVDEDAMLGRIDDSWGLVLTTVPGTRARLDRDPAFGLASTDASGRRDAIGFVHDVLATARRIDRALGRTAVRAVALVSAPTTAEDARAASGAALTDALTQVLQGDVDGRTLLVEHCDAVVPGQAPAKGYLSMADEVRCLAALREAGHENVGALVNWGRSALERRSVEGPVEHLRLAREAGVLSGLVLSGCAAVDGPFGPAWADAHTPPAPSRDQSGEPTSLLDDTEIARSLAETTHGTTHGTAHGTMIGIKVAARPRALGVEGRVELQRTTLRRVEAALSS